MNIAYFLTPKHDVVYVYDDATIRQGLKKMRHYSYTAIPVISRDGQYVGTVSEGDFLRRLVPEDGDIASVKDMEQDHIRDIMLPDAYPAVPITVSIDDLLRSAMNQNFVPVVDDYGSFTGIVRRKDIIRFLANTVEQTAVSIPAMNAASLRRSNARMSLQPA